MTIFIAKTKKIQSLIFLNCCEPKQLRTVAIQPPLQDHLRVSVQVEKVTTAVIEYTSCIHIDLGKYLQTGYYKVFQLTLPSSEQLAMQSPLLSMLIWLTVVVCWKKMRKMYQESVSFPTRKHIQGLVYFAS